MHFVTQTFAGSQRVIAMQGRHTSTLNTYYIVTFLWCDMCVMFTIALYRYLVVFVTVAHTKLTQLHGRHIAVMLHIICNKLAHLQVQVNPKVRRFTQRIYSLLQS